MPINTPVRGRFLPKNRRLPEVASRTLENLAQTAKLQYVNALYVNGVPSVIYPRLENGRKCTCRGIHKTSVLDEAGNLSQDDLTTLLASEDVVIRAPGERSPTRRAPGVERMRLDDLEVFKLPTEPQNNDPARNQMESFVIDDTDLVDAPITQGIETDVLEGISPAGRTMCAVCFGTGFVGGYNVHGGYRTVLDVTYGRQKLDRMFYDTTATPHTFVGQDTGCSVEFWLLLPRGTSRIQALRVFDNQNVIDVRNYVLEIETPTGWVALSQSTLLSFCDGLEHHIRLTAHRSDDFRFSHIEIQGQVFAELVHVDFPKLDKNPYLAVFDGLTGSQLIIPPTVGELPYLSAVADALYGQIWMLTNVTEFNDHVNHIHGWESLGRHTQPFEVHNLLPHPNKAWIKPAQENSKRHLGDGRKFL